jgi:RNA polymerase sigma-70 factor (ECF subfamily)
MVAGDEFDELYRASFRRLVGQLFLVLGDLHEAEDVVQEAFARASTRWRTLRQYEIPEAWFRRVAFNLAADSGRRRRRWLRALVHLAPPPEVPPASDAVLDLVAALGELPMSQRQPLVLHYLLDLPVEQVAAELGLSTGSVKTRLFRGRHALAAAISRPTQEVTSSDR